MLDTKDNVKSLENSLSKADFSKQQQLKDLAQKTVGEGLISAEQFKKAYDNAKPGEVSPWEHSRSVEALQHKIGTEISQEPGTPTDGIASIRAEKARVEALAVQQQEEQGNHTTIQRTGNVAEERVKGLPADVRNKFDIKDGKTGDLYHFRDTDRVAFKHSENKITVKPALQDVVARDVVAVADASGWERIKVTGPEKFRRDVWKEATERGIETSGYEPTAQERVEMDSKALTVSAERKKMSQGKPDKLVAAGDPKRQKYEEIENTMTRSEAIKQYPEMKAYYEVIDNATKYAVVATKSTPVGNAFIEKVRGHALDVLARGDSIEIKQQSKQYQQKAPEQTPERNRETQLELEEIER